MLDCLPDGKLDAIRVSGGRRYLAARRSQRRLLHQAGRRHTTSREFRIREPLALRPVAHHLSSGRQLLKSEAHCRYRPKAGDNPGVNAHQDERRCYFLPWSKRVCGDDAVVMLLDHAGGAKCMIDFADATCTEPVRSRKRWSASREIGARLS